MITLKQTQIDKICSGNHPEPFSFLGQHKVFNPLKKNSEYNFRAFYPNAKEIWIESNNNLFDKFKMEKIDDRGFFETLFDKYYCPESFVLEIHNHSGNKYKTNDPFSFGRIISDYDIYLFNEGSHYYSYEKLGAQIKNIKGISGTLFTVWAPNAFRVSIVGNFNDWDERRHPMRLIEESGIYEIFIPLVGENDLYKYSIKTKYGENLLKSDPYAFYTQLRPENASIVCNHNNFVWTDREWMEKREKRNTYEKPVAIYECNLSSFARDPETNSFLSYRELADKLIDYVKDTGYTHVEFMPLAEHPYDASWGYQVTGYYSPTSRFGHPSGLKHMIDKLHNNNIGVIMDWVPAHFPKDANGLAKFDGTCLFEHSHPYQGEHKDWGTLIFNYSRNEIRSFLISNAIYWFDKFHFDGLRVDAVASMLYLDYSRKDGEWIPNEYGGRENLAAIDFIKQLNSAIYSNYKNVMMIAEESTSWPNVTKPVNKGGLGFTYKWNMGWMNDFLRYISLDPIYRKYEHNLMTFSMMYHYSEKFILPLSHDEVVYGKGSMINKIPGDKWQKFATLRTSMAYFYSHPGKKLLFMGNDFAQYEEWHFDQSLDWHILDQDMNKKFHLFMKDINSLYNNEYSLFECDYDENGFKWINPDDADRSIFSFIRYSKYPDNFLIFVFNFTPVVYHDYKIGVPSSIYYKEILNSDSYTYGGSNIGNQGGKEAEFDSYNDFPCSLSITVPPLGCVVFKPEVKASS